MALFGEKRDVNFIRGINRELLGTIINQEVAYYKPNLLKTNINIYGEAAEGRNFQEPILFNCLIDRGDQLHPTSDLGVDLSRVVSFWFLKDDLKKANNLVEIGDIIQYYNGYFEVDSVVENQLFVGKDNEYPYNGDNSNNPLNPGLDKFGWSVSIKALTHETPADKVGILKSRL